MDDGWRNISTTSVELYEYQAADGAALIFRHRNGQQDYLACIVGAERHVVADEHFPTIDAAKAWVAGQLARWHADQ